MSTTKQHLPKIHLACGTSEIDTNKNLIKIRNNIASATNGVILVRIELSEKYKDFCTPEVMKILNGKCIHKNVWKEIYQCDLLQVTEDEIVCFKDSIKKIFEYATPNGSLWDDEYLIRQIRDAGEEKKRIIKYNAAQISIISKIFEDNELNFSFTKGQQGTFVYPYHGCGMFAVLMPIETSESRYYFS